MRIIALQDPSILQICLDCLPFFDSFSAEEKKDLILSGADLLRYNTGEFLVAEGGEDRPLFFLLSGAATVVKQGASIPIVELTPGNLFGEIAFLTGQKRTSNVIVHPVSAVGNERPSTVLSESLCQELCPDDPAPTIALRLNHTVLDNISAGTRLKMKDQIIAVLVDRVEHMSERIEEIFGEVPDVPVDPELDRLMTEGGGENLEQVKDHIFLHLVDFLMLLNKKIIEEAPN
jgi:CRP/FNR family transcriptional regulator, cyclic AMP receptor protein